MLELLVRWGVDAGFFGRGADVEVGVVRRGVDVGVVRLGVDVGVVRWSVDVGVVRQCV